MIAEGELLEYAEYVGNYYGTPLAPILEATERGIDVVMDLDVVGALKVKARVLNTSICATPSSAA